MLNKRICKICVDSRRTKANDTARADEPQPWNSIDEEEWHCRALVFCLAPNWVSDVRGGPPSWCPYMCEQTLDPVENYEFTLQRGYERMRGKSLNDGRKQMVPILKDLGITR